MMWHLRLPVYAACRAVYFASKSGSKQAKIVTAMRLVRNVAGKAKERCFSWKSRFLPEDAKRHLLESATAILAERSFQVYRVLNMGDPNLNGI